MSHHIFPMSVPSARLAPEQPRSDDAKPPSRKTEGDEFGRMVQTADRHDNILFFLEEVCHRRAGSARLEFSFPHDLSCPLVVRAEFVAAAARRNSDGRAIALPEE